MLRNLSSFRSIFFALSMFVLLAGSAYSADPGTALPTNSEVSDQKVGSVLFYNLYISSASGGSTTNTRFTMTNVSLTTSAFVHLFFVSDSGTVSDSYICLTPAQTAAFLASDVDPGIKGYMLAVAVDNNGCPISHNFLSGSAAIKLSTGHEGTLPAEAFAAQFNGVIPGCAANQPTATLLFDGSVNGYNRAPRMLAVEKLKSTADGNLTILVINRVGGNLLTGVSTTGTLAGVLYDDLSASTTFTLASLTQIFGTLSDTFPVTTPVYSAFIPTGRTGWLKFYNPTADFGLLGAVLNFNASSGSSASAFVGGHNLRKLTLSASNTYTFPVFPPSC